MSPARCFLKTTLAWLLALMLALLCFTGGCGDDDTTTTEPEIIPDPPVRPVTEDSLMTLFADAFANLDGDLFMELIAPDYRFVFDPDFVSESAILQSELNPVEAIDSTIHMLSGASISGGGVFAPGISGILVDNLEMADNTWSDGTFGDHENVRQSLFDITMTVSFNGVAHDTVITGQARFFLAGRDTMLDNPKATWFSLVGISDLTAGASEAGTASWSEIQLAYLINHRPQPVITTPDSAGVVGSVFTLSADQSSDTDSGLANLPYRWRFSADGQWSDWTANPDTTISYAASGEMVVTLMVRDRWGVTDFTFQLLAVNPELAATPDAVIAGLESAYLQRNLFTYLFYLDEQYTFLLRPETMAEWELDSNEFTYVQEHSSADLMFACANFIALDLVEVSAWEPTDGDHSHFAGAQQRTYSFELNVFDETAGLTHQAYGQQIFFVTSRDTVIEGAEQTYWLLIGQQDLSTLPGDQGLEVTWSHIKLNY